jgi:hypothetical protein
MHPLRVYIIRIESGDGKQWLLQAADPDIKPRYSKDDMVDAFNQYAAMNKLYDARIVLHLGVLQQSAAEKLIADLHFKFQGADDAHSKAVVL